MNTGGKVEKFEQLKVFEEARKLTNRIYEVTRRQTFAKDFGLVDQIRRAAVSVMSNIAEGFERGANKEFIQFLCDFIVVEFADGETPISKFEALFKHATETQMMELMSAVGGGGADAKVPPEKSAPSGTS